MRVLVLGTSGMAGHVVKKYLEKNLTCQVYGTGFKNCNSDLVLLDVFNLDDVVKVLNEIRPDFIINCIGALINESKNNPDKTIFINSFFPHFLAKEAKKINSKLIHLSTDCVFSGKGNGNYDENSFRDAYELYGQSKALGEICNQENVLTIRTSIIGPEIKKTKSEGLLDWFINQKNKIKGYRSAFWSGVTTLELAKFILFIIKNDFPLSGLYHLTNNTKICKYDLLKLFSKHINTDIEIEEDSSVEVDKSFVNTNTFLVYKVPKYDEMISDLFFYINKNKSNYTHYDIY